MILVSHAYLPCLYNPDPVSPFRTQDRHTSKAVNLDPEEVLYYDLRYLVDTSETVPSISSLHCEPRSLVILTLVLLKVKSQSDTSMSPPSIGIQCRVWEQHI